MQGGFGSSLITCKIGDFRTVLVASPETVRQHSDFITRDQTLPVPFVINEPRCIFRQIFEEYLRLKAIHLGHTIELWSIPTIKNLVASGVGITYLPLFTVQEELKIGTLEEIRTDIEDPTITAVCGYHKNKWVRPLMQLFIDLCKEHANREMF